MAPGSASAARASCVRLPNIRKPVNISCVSFLKRPAGSAVYGLRILNHYFSQRFAGALEEHDLTLPQMGIMFDVIRIRGVSSAGLARARHMTPQTMSEII